MENKKLLKFLYKDIAEIEELFQEKGAEGFDEYEIEFIHSRFKGAKQVLQILSEKENKKVEKIRPRPALQSYERVQQSPLANEEVESLQTQPADEEKESEQAPLTTEVEESLSSLSEFEKELKEDKEAQPQQREAHVDVKEEQAEPVVEEEVSEQSQSELEEKEIIKEEPVSNNKQAISSSQQSESGGEDSESEVDLRDEAKVDEANHRLGDSFAKEKSVNELLAGDATKLEYKISNSPVESIKAAIGINDRYQYIRELFEGNADTFSKTVSELDDLKSIKEAVAYLQQNYKWKKNDTSLKFVNLIKRRFPNE